MKEKMISYGKAHPKAKNMIIAILAMIIFIENVRKAAQTGFGKRKTGLTGGYAMYDNDEQLYEESISVRNVEYNSEQVKKQLKPVNRAVAVPVVLVCVAALGMTGFAGEINLPSQVSARADSKAEDNSKVNLLEQPKIQMVEPEVAVKEEMQTTASVEEAVIDNDTLPWNLILINDDYPVSENYEANLVYVEGKQVDERIAESLKAMLEAARAAGMKCKICSAYRTSQKQESLVEKDVAKYKARGYDDDEALQLTYEGVSPVNHSEHQTGLTVDIVSASHQSLDAAHANTKEAIWLKEHCKEYGFIVRYMEGKEDITHRKAESWHFRYVGVEAATEIMENGITLEEYLEEYITKS